MSNEKPATREPDEDTANVEPPSSEGTSRGRAIAAVICLVLAGLLTTPAAVAYWGQRTLNDADRYVDTVGPLVDSPKRSRTSSRPRSPKRSSSRSTSRRSSTTSSPASSPNGLGSSCSWGHCRQPSTVSWSARSATFIASDEFAEFWTRVNTRAQEALHRILTGDDSGAVSLKDDQVVLDVDEVISRVKERLVDRGLTIAENIPVPETDRQIVLMDAPQLRQARTIYAFSNPVAKWLLPLVGLLFLGAFLLARRRPRMTVWIGAIVAANALLLALMLSVGQQLFVNHLAGTAFGPASRVFYKTLLAYLERGQEVVLWLGLILVVAGLYAGANRYGTAIRTTLSGGLENIGTKFADTGLDAIARTGRWVAANAGWLRVVVRRPGRGRASLGEQRLHGTAVVVPSAGAGPARGPAGPGRRRPSKQTAPARDMSN